MENQKAEFGVKDLLLQALFIVLAVLPFSACKAKDVLDKQLILESESFWDNKDWDWYKENIPFFDSPDEVINTTYYYRWEVVTKHLVYGSPETGYTFTEFIDRPGWSGRYGSISCPAGHQLYEVRWSNNKRFARDYARYWFRTKGAQPRRYSTWLADSVWALYRVHNDKKFTIDLLNDIIKNYKAWERDHFVPEVGMFWQHGMADGMETNINSRQTDNWFSGASGYRPTLNSYMYADALAISKIAKMAGKADIAKEYKDKAANLKKKVQEILWDRRRQFFLHMFMRDEKKKDVDEVIKAMTRTYETGKYAGNEHGREEIGFIPWQFNLPDTGYEVAWKFLMDPEYFYADYGPTVTERNDPLFHISPSCCVWSGNSWPYATTQTLKAFANLLNNYKQDYVDKDDYFELLKIYSKTHRKNGKPYIAEAAHPDTGSWKGHDHFNHSEHYFHSGYVDLIITGLVGLHPRADNVIEVNPLVPDEWDYFALDDVLYHGHRLAIVWDRKGTKYDLGKGLKILADGKEIASSETIKKIEVELPTATSQPEQPNLINYAVNNEGSFYPRMSASYTNAQTPLNKINDGNYWYHISPPNRWSCLGSGNVTDWCEVQFGTQRPVSCVKLYFLDDGEKIVAPQEYELQYWDGKDWKKIPAQKRYPEKPTGHRANVITFAELKTSKIKVVFTHKSGSFTGLTEFEAWGEGTLPLSAPTEPVGNIAYNKDGRGYPKASASFTSRFDRIQEINDGVSLFSSNSRNRWTAFESPNESDWVEIDFGQERSVHTLMLHFYDDRGSVQPPKSYNVQYWDGSKWTDAQNQKKNPPEPEGSAVNTVTIEPVKTSKIRVVFVHKSERSFSGLTELEIWGDN